VSERWPIPYPTRAKVPKVLAAILTSRKAAAKDRVAAAKVMIEMDRVNVTYEELAEARRLRAAIEDMRVRLDRPDAADVE
jgi:hypothetical protein